MLDRDTRSLRPHVAYFDKANFTGSFSNGKNPKCCLSVTSTCIPSEHNSIKCLVKYKSKLYYIGVIWSSPSQRHPTGILQYKSFTLLSSVKR